MNSIHSLKFVRKKDMIEKVPINIQVLKVVEHTVVNLDHMHLFPKLVKYTVFIVWITAN